MPKPWSCECCESRKEEETASSQPVVVSCSTAQSGHGHVSVEGMQALLSVSQHWLPGAQWPKHRSLRAEPADESQPPFAVAAHRG